MTSCNVLHWQICSWCFSIGPPIGLGIQQYHVCNGPIDRLSTASKSELCDSHHSRAYDYLANVRTNEAISFLLEVKLLELHPPRIHRRTNNLCPICHTSASASASQGTMTKLHVRTKCTGTLYRTQLQAHVSRTSGTFIWQHIKVVRCQFRILKSLATSRPGHSGIELFCQTAAPGKAIKGWSKQLDPSDLWQGATWLLTCGCSWYGASALEHITSPKGTSMHGHKVSRKNLAQWTFYHGGFHVETYWKLSPNL